jgi:hypothetical protein
MHNLSIRTVAPIKHGVVGNPAQQLVRPAHGLGRFIRPV